MYGYGWLKNTSKFLFINRNMNHLTVLHSTYFVWVWNLVSYPKGRS